MYTPTVIAYFCRANNSEKAFFAAYKALDDSRHVLIVKLHAAAH